MENIQNKKKKVLLVSFYFPPNNSIAAIRIGKFAKYLPEFGWEPIILTVNKGTGLTQTLPLETASSNVIKTPYSILSDSLSRIFHENYDAPSQNTIEQNINNSTNSQKGFSEIASLANNIFSTPMINKLVFDPMGWYRPAVKAGLDIIKTQNIKVIFSSYGPSVSHFIADKLHRKSQIPWVADFRDEWTDAYDLKRLPKFFCFLDHQWEKHTMKSCNTIVTVSQPIAEMLEKSHSKETVVIANGFDDEDFKEPAVLTPKFTITHTGYIYPGKRDPSPLLQALAEARSEGKISPKVLEVRFYGQNIDKLIIPLIKKYNVEDFVHIGGYIPYKESLKKQMESTVLLFLAWNDPSDSGRTAGKIYEYLAAKRPILGLAYQGGEIDKLIQESGCGIVTNDVAKIKFLLVKWLKELSICGKISTYYNPNHDIINKYTRKGQARDLAAVFDKLIEVIPKNWTGC